MKIIYALLFFVLSSLTSSYGMTIDELGKTTVCLRKSSQFYEMKNGRKKEIWYKDFETKTLEPKLTSITATGFLIDHNKKIYLVTAGHVAREMSKEAEIIWNTASGKSMSYTIEFLQKNLPGSKWFYHPRADIAIHLFGFSEQANHILIPENVFSNIEEEVPLLTKVCVLGFPLGLGIKNIISPVAKKTEIASGVTTIDHPNIDSRLKFILLDDDLAQGYSGAPIFISPEPQMKGNAFIVGGVQPKLLGVQSMTISDQTGGKISLIVPVFYLVEIFNLEDFKAFEKEIERSKNEK